VPPDYLTMADLLGMHTMLIQRYGGSPGARDPCIKCYYLKVSVQGPRQPTVNFGSAEPLTTA